MTKRTYATLKELRTDLLKYRFESVARLSGVSTDRLRSIEERNEPPTIAELESLVRLYGIDAERLGDEPIQLEAGDGVEVLACLDEYRDLPDGVRARILATANAAKDLRSLQAMVGDEMTDEIDNLRAAIGAPDVTVPPFRQGARLATKLRGHLGLGEEPIPSVRDLMNDSFPWISVLYGSLTASGPAGITFADSLRGPAIVLNLDGKNLNPAVRRFSLAHELCHLLVDWRQPESLAILSGYFSESALDRERRANAFAVRLLCPEPVLRRLDRNQPIVAAHELLHYGLHYAAARLYLRVEAGIALPPVPPPALAGIGTQEWLGRAEEPSGVVTFPIESAPPERRGVVAQAAARAFAAGLIGRDRFTELVGVTPVAEIERVLDFFGLPAPDLADAAA